MTHRTTLIKVNNMTLGWTLAIWLTCGAPLAHAQWTKELGQRGFVPGAPFDIGGLDSVNMANGNVVINIPITGMAPGRAGHGINISLTYNSSHWNTSETGLSSTPPAEATRLQDSGAWNINYGFRYGLYVEEHIGDPGCQHPQQVNGPYQVTPSDSPFQYRTRMIFPDGSQHVLYLASTAGPWLAEDTLGSGWFTYDPAGKPSACVASISGTPAWITGNLTYYTRDGTSIRLVTGGGAPGNYWWNLPWTMYFPDGRRVEGVGDQTTGIYDRNGNKVTVTKDPVSPCFTPATNTAVYDITDEAFPSAKRCMQVEFGQGLNAHDYIRQNGADGNPIVWDVTWQNLANSIGFSYACMVVDQVTQLPTLGSCPFPAFGNSQNVITRLDMNQFTCGGADCAKSYQFLYEDSYSGQLTTVILPTGGKLHYQYNGVGTIDDMSNQFILWTKSIEYQDPETSSILVEPLQYNISVANSCNTVMNSDQGVASQVSHCFHNPYGYGQLGGRAYKIQQPDGSSVETFWFRSPPNNDGSWTGDANPMAKREIRTVAAGGSPTVSAIKDFKTDLNGNIHQVDEYDWVSYSSIPHPNNTPSSSINDFPTTGLTLIRSTATLYSYDVPLSVFPVPTNRSTPGADEYWHSTATLLNAPASVSVTTSGLDSYTQFDYDDARHTGNVLKEWRWDNAKPAPFTTPLTSSNAVMTERTYQNGDVVFEYDPDRRTTLFQYNNSTHPYPTDLFEAYGAPEVRHWSFVWNTDIGLRTSETDVDNSLTTNVDYDKRGRVTLLKQGNDSRETKTEYDDGARTVTVKADLTFSGDKALQTVIALDQLGRKWKTTNTRLGIETRQFQRTEASGTFQLASNPFYLTAANSGWTRTALDKNGRVVEVRSFTGSGKPAPWGTNASSSGATTTVYGAECTGSSQCTNPTPGATLTVTDPAGNQRKLVSDGLGRLKYVVEAGTYTTTYGYNALDNLSGVNQSGQTRTFFYSSLGRLTGASNPESGTVSYTYDNSGNLLTRTDARSLVTTTAYDNLKRTKTKSYSDGTTPNVTYCYDGTTWTGTYAQCTGSRVALLVGHLTEEGSSVSSTTFTNYDSLGRVTASAQKTAGIPYLSFSYQYKLNDGLSQITYPSGRVVNYAYDGGGRVQAVGGIQSGNSKDYTDPSTPISYAPHGSLDSLKFASPNVLVEQHCYNSRLQPIGIRVGASVTTDCADSSDILNLSYTFSATQNNGNVQGQTITRRSPQSGTQTWTHVYTYTDGLNRLTGASESGSGSWTQTYGYDPSGRGNRWVTSSGLPSASFEVPNANWYLSSNRISSPNGAWTYDAAGNLQAISGMPDRSFDYDAENRMKSAIVNGPTTTYKYDGEGRRVSKTWNGQTTTFVYDAFGNLAAEYGGPIGGSGTQYLTSDHLGSTRLVTDSSGAAMKCYDYLPFGEEIGNGTAGRTAPCFGSGSYPVTGGGTNVEFTSKERDAETGLDFFGARYLSSAQGRFTSPDPKLFPHDITDPQSWNKYGYTRNNPLRYVDPNGQDWMESLAAAWEGFKQYGRDLIQPLTDTISGNSGNQPDNTPMAPGLPSRQDIVRAHADALAKGTGVIADAVGMIDPTGVGAATRSALSGDTKGTILAMAVMGIPGGGGAEGKVALSEAKQLVSGWSSGTFEKVGQSIAYHFEKHGAEVGADSVWQYLRKAEGFAGNLKRATRTGLEDGAARYEKNGKYVILDKDKKILSFGNVE